MNKTDKRFLLALEEAMKGSVKSNKRRKLKVSI